MTFFDFRSPKNGRWAYCNKANSQETSRGETTTSQNFPSILNHWYKNNLPSLSDNDYDGAIQAFSQALKLVKSLLAQQEEDIISEHYDDDDDDDDQMDTEEDTMDFFANDQSSSSSFHCADANNAPQHATTKLPSTKEFIFRTPVVVTVNDDAESIQSFQYYVMLSYVLLYNLALAHHLSALELHHDASAQPRKLKRAVALYELACQIQMNEGIQLSTIQTMAIVNNLGRIHQHWDQ